MKLRKENILIVDDDYDMLELLQRNLKILNFHTYKASSVTEAIEILKQSTIDLLITDLQMPGINGLELIKFAQEHFPNVPKLVVTGYPSLDSAVSSVKSGALDYLVKPFKSEELQKAVEHVLKGRSTPFKTDLKFIDEVTHYAGMIGKSAQFINLIDVIERVKNNRATVLIQGESGTGKELIARAIHYKGTYASNPFIVVNCGSIPENLLESELFGHVKGAFTGANENRVGFFQAANGGTIFLDEIGNAPLNVQMRLLRVLQEKEITMVGSSQSQKIQVRVIAATNSNLLEMVHKGLFREDLYYRLNVVDITTAPLRERKEDIAAIIAIFLKKYDQEYGKSNSSITDEALKLLLRHSWPGNIRELENVIQRLIIMGESTIDVVSLPDHFKYKLQVLETSLKSLKEVELEHIHNVLQATNNNKTKASEILKIDRKTLRLKLKE
jgi:two-component system response regulator HydG